MKYVFYCILFIFNIIFSFAENMGQLPELMQPQHFVVVQDKLYILEETTIFIYALNRENGQENLKLLSHFGSKGRGPGEMETSPFQPNRLSLNGINLLVESPFKLLYFDLNGVFLKEIRKPARLILRTLPVKSGFVTKEVDRSDGRVEFITVNLVALNWEIKQELYRQSSPIQRSYADMIADSIFIAVNDDKIFIERSPEAICVDVFDHKGCKLDTIRMKMKPKIVSDYDKIEIMNAYKDDPLVKEIGFSNLKESIEFRFPETFPAIRDMLASEKTLFIQSAFSKNEMDTYYVLTSESQKIRSIDLPSCQKSEDLSQANGVGIRHYYFSEDFFYVLLENEANEVWHLNRLKW